MMNLQKELELKFNHKIEKVSTESETKIPTLKEKAKEGN
jgi:hypothetical protein